MNPELHKVLIPPSEYRNLLRALYAEDLDMITKFHQNAGEGLDACVDDELKQISPGSKFYKVEMPDGTLFGYFVVAGPVEGQHVMEGFFIRITFRTKDYKDAFIKLINETFSNNFYTSTSAANYRAINFLLKYNFSITNPAFEYFGKTFVILEATN